MLFTIISFPFLIFFIILFFNHKEFSLRLKIMSRLVSQYDEDFVMDFLKTYWAFIKRSDGYKNLYVLVLPKDEGMKLLINYSHDSYILRYQKYDDSIKILGERYYINNKILSFLKFCMKEAGEDNETSIHRQESAIIESAYFTRRLLGYNYINPYNERNT